MYRHASLRVPCVVCRVEQPLARMEMAPRGGQWCWKCQMRAQISEHDRAARPRPTYAVVCAAVLGTGVAAACLIGLYLVFCVVVLLVGWGPC